MFKLPFGIKFHFKKETIISHQSQHSAGINAIEFLENEDKFITGSSDDTIRIFNLIGEELAFFGGHFAPINDLAIHPSEEYFASVSDDKSLRIWNLKSLKEDSCFLEANKSLNAVIFSRDGSKIITGGKDKKLRVYDFDKRKFMFEIDINPIISLVNHPTEEIVIVGSTSRISVIDLNLKVKILDLSGHTLPIQQLDVSDKSPNGKYFLVSCSIDETVKLWDLEKYQELFSFKPHGGAVTCAKFRPGTQNNYFATGSYDRSVAIFEQINPKPIQRYRGPKLSVKDIAWSRDGSKLGYASSDGSVRIVDIEEKKELLKIDKNLELISSLFFDKNKNHLLLGMETGNIVVTKLKGDIVTTNENLHSAPINILSSFEINDNKTIIVTAGNDKLIKFWDSDNWKLLAEAKGHKSGIRGFVISPDKTYFLSCSNDATIRKFDLIALIESFSKSKDDFNSEETEFPFELKEIQVYKHHRYSVNDIALSNNGKYFATASNDHTVALFDSETFTNRLIMKGHKDHVLSLMFSNDDKRLYTGCKNGDIIIFETTSAKILNSLNYHNDAVRKILPAKNNYFITISDDNSSLVFSNTDTVVGQTFFSTNAKALVLDEKDTNYYVSTDIGELFKISANFDALSYQTQSTTTNFDQLLMELETEIEIVENSIDKTEQKLEKLLFWTLFRQNWLDSHKTKFSDNKVLLSLYERLRRHLEQFSEEKIQEIQTEVKNYLNNN
ncbi:MAG: WD40 domain-containing protein [Candidatus Hodarchaeales archaeon]|jgi:WD40 repeat protein